MTDLQTPPAPAAPIADPKPAARKFAGMAALFSVACLACLLPGLLAGGALAATFGALGADALVFGGLAIAMAVAALAVVLRRRRADADGGDNCGC
jgi:hypothetical protein